MENVECEVIFENLETRKSKSYTKVYDTFEQCYRGAVEYANDENLVIMEIRVLSFNEI